ncbi:hypothetical protein U0355_09930 [Salimicrobium sp. PL1-032A]|uniref:hypothetical protein n=1 Tax=Salimicrobium sp. PL1-032A TaxID=3095364 RepID=UPI0032617320
MKRSKVVLLNILGIFLIGLVVIGFALLTDITPVDEEQESLKMNEEEERLAESPVRETIVEEAEVSS